MYLNDLFRIPKSEIMGQIYMFTFVQKYYLVVKLGGQEARFNRIKRS